MRILFFFFLLVVSNVVASKSYHFACTDVSQYGSYHYKHVRVKDHNANGNGLTAEFVRSQVTYETFEPLHSYEPSGLSPYSSWWNGVNFYASIYVNDVSGVEQVVVALNDSHHGTVNIRYPNNACSKKGSYARCKVDTVYDEKCENALGITVFAYCDSLPDYYKLKSYSECNKK